VPIAVFVLGVISIVMLYWIHPINEGQRIDLCISSAFTDIQNLAASSHLWLEQAICRKTGGVL